MIPHNQDNVLVYDKRPPVVHYFEFSYFAIGRRSKITK